ncbi:MAG: hypothetical protein KGH75_01515 [Rhodospirillales bacterium]|nr:hypothetical protein [Rhodospirillales bacterium]
MATATVVQGETLTYSQVGSVITNDLPLRTIKNLPMTTQDLFNNNVTGLNMLVASCTASAGSGTNSFVIPATVTTDQGTYDGVSYSGVNVTSTGTVTGVAIHFPATTQVGQTLKLTFDVAVTSVSIVLPAGYTIQNTAYSSAFAATANEVINFALYEGLIWKNV